MDALQTKPKTKSRRPFFNAGVLAPQQPRALELYALGLNVFPQPHGRKQGLPHRLLQATRLYYDPNDRRADDLLDVTAGRCNLAIMTGRTSRNLFVIDCESAATYKLIGDQLDALGIAFWSVTSPGRQHAGGGHIYLLSSDGELVNIPAGTHRQLEVWANRHYVLAPGSLHPEPLTSRAPLYEWDRHDGQDIPSVSLHELTLFDLDGKVIQFRLTRQHRQRSQPLYIFTPHNRTTADYLRSGRTLTEPGRRMALFTAACDYARCNVAGYNGYSKEDAERDLTPVADGSGLPSQEINRAITEAYLFVTQPTYKGQGHQHTAAYDWQYALAFADAHQWSGRTASADRAVFLALVERAREGGNDAGTFRASVREIAEHARVNRNTAHAAIKRLQTATPPLVCYAGKDGDKGTDTAEQRANLWRFSDYVVREGRKCGEFGTVRSTNNGLSSSVLISPKTDAAERGALGGLGLHIYQVMQTMTEPATLKEIAERAGVTVTQARYHITGHKTGGGKLLTYGLVIRDGRHYSAQAYTNEELDRLVAAPAGTYGKGDQRRQKHAQERALYAGALIMQARYTTDQRNLFFGEREPQELFQAKVAAGAESVVYPAIQYEDSELSTVGVSRLNPYSRGKTT